MFHVNTPFWNCCPTVKRDYLMRISESKCFLWHRLCLLPQGTTRQMGLLLLLQRGHVEGGGVLQGRASQPRAPAPTSTTATGAARSSPASRQKHGDSSRLGTGEEFPPSNESRIREYLLARVAWGKGKMLLQLSSAISALCWRGLGLKARLFCSGLLSCEAGY